MLQRVRICPFRCVSVNVSRSCKSEEQGDDGWNLCSRCSRFVVVAVATMAWKWFVGCVSSELKC